MATKKKTVKKAVKVSTTKKVNKYGKPHNSHGNMIRRKAAKEIKRDKVTKAEPEVNVQDEVFNNEVIPEPEYDENDEFFGDDLDESVDFGDE